MRASLGSEVVQDNQISGKKYGLVEGLWCSFTDPQFYKFVLNSWHGIGLRYVCILAVIFACAFTSAEYFKVMSNLSAPESETMFHGMPTLLFKNGSMSTASADGKLVVMKKEGFDKNVIVIDPNDTLSFEDAGAPVLLQSKQFIVQMMPKRKPLTLKYANFLHDKQMTGMDILNQLKSLANSSVLPIFLFVYVVTFALIFARAIVFALIMKLFRTKHSFAGATRLIVVASTPSLLLAALVAWLNIQGVWQHPIYAFLFFLYFGLSFRWCRLEKS